MKPSRPRSTPAPPSFLVGLLALLTLLGAAACDAPAQAPGQGSDTAEPSGTPEAPNPLAAYDAGAEEADVLAALQSLFDALESGDEELLRSVTDPSVVMHYAETVDGETAQGSATVDELATRIASSEERLIERMWDPVVLMDGPLATVWTPYDFYVGEAFSHCGVDVANLLRTEDGWRIVGLSWTRRQPPACDRHPEGPPSG